MPVNITPFSGLSDHIDADARSHDGRGVDSRMCLRSPAARCVCGATLIADGASMQGNWVSSLLPGPDEF